MHRPADGGGPTTDAAGWLEALLYVTPDRRITLAARGSGRLGEISRTFDSRAELGAFLAELLTGPGGEAHPVLAALADAARAVGAGERLPESDGRGG